MNGNEKGQVSVLVQEDGDKPKSLKVEISEDHNPGPATKFENDE